MDLYFKHKYFFFFFLISALFNKSDTQKQNNKSTLHFLNCKDKKTISFSIQTELKKRLRVLNYLFTSLK